MRAPIEPPEFRYCPACGTPLRRDTSTQRPTCPSCGFIHYLNPIAVVAGVLLSTSPVLPAPGEFVRPERATHILLVRRATTYAGQWCIPCGYLEYDEEIRTAAAREMREETGLDVEVREPLAVLSNFHRPHVRIPLIPAAQSTRFRPPSPRQSGHPVQGFRPPSGAQRRRDLIPKPSSLTWSIASFAWSRRRA